MLLLYGLAAYATAGLIFALWFVIAGIGRLDAAARDAGFGFRLIVLPGVAALWPLLLKRSIEATMTRSAQTCSSADLDCTRSVASSVVGGCHCGETHDHTTKS